MSSDYGCFVSFTCTENVCPPVPSLPHAIPNTTLARMGTVVSLECEEGFEKSIKNQNYTIVCTEDLAWTESSNYCTGIQCFLKNERFIFIIRLLFS